LDELRGHADYAHGEAARAIIDEGLAAGKTLEEVRGDERDFNRVVAERTWRREAEADPDGLSVFDRGLPDLAAWARVYGSDAPDGLEASARGWRYSKVFLLEPLPFVEDDGVRIEDAEFNVRLHAELLRAYEEVGEEVVVVPAVSVVERKRFILSHLGSVSGA
jgi:predicted ATPase